MENEKRAREPPLKPILCAVLLGLIFGLVWFILPNPLSGTANFLFGISIIVLSVSFSRVLESREAEKQGIAFLLLTALFTALGFALSFGLFVLLRSLS